MIVSQKYSILTINKIYSNDILIKSYKKLGNTCIIISNPITSGWTWFLNMKNIRKTCYQPYILKYESPAWFHGCILLQPTVNDRMQARILLIFSWFGGILSKQCVSWGKKGSLWTGENKLLQKWPSGSWEKYYKKSHNFGTYE